MKAIRSKDTRIENKVVKELRKKNLKFRRNVNSLFGKPDIASKKLKVAIFIDSCFWHGCPYHCRMPVSNVIYWKNKIKRNKQRDKEVNKWYIKNRWKLLRLWEHKIEKNTEQCVKKISAALSPGS